MRTSSALRAQPDRREFLLTGMAFVSAAYADSGGIRFPEGSRRASLSAARGGSGTLTFQGRRRY